MTYTHHTHPVLSVFVSSGHHAFVKEWSVDESGLVRGVCALGLDHRLGVEMPVVLASPAIICYLTQEEWNRSAKSAADWLNTSHQRLNLQTQVQEAAKQMLDDTQEGEDWKH